MSQHYAVDVTPGPAEDQPERTSPIGDKPDETTPMVEEPPEEVMPDALAQTQWGVKRQSETNIETLDPRSTLGPEVGPEDFCGVPELDQLDTVVTKRRHDPNVEPIFIGDDEDDEREADELDVAPEHVAAAKPAELKQLQQFDTLTVVHKSEVQLDEHILVGTRWVITNKGTTLDPRVKARLVAKEFREKSGTDELFSGTPGLSGIRYVISELATNNDGRIAMVADVKGAFLYGKAARDILIRLPPEYGVGKDFFGKLKNPFMG